MKPTSPPDLGPNPDLRSAQNMEALAAKLLASAYRNLDRITAQQLRTEPFRVVITAEREAPIPSFQLVVAGAFLLVGIFALWLTNLTGTNLLVGSGNDLFADNPWAASFYMSVALLGGFALKAFEHRIPSDSGQRIYSTIIFGFGITALVVWIGAVAIVFSPQPASMSWLTGDGAEETRLIGIVALFSHLVSDLAASFVVFAGAEHILLGDRKRILIPNIAYLELTKTIDALVAKIEDLTAQKSAAQDYVRRYAAQIEQARLRAEAELSAARTDHEAISNVAPASSKVTFLKR